jgi:hypothetical protein
MEKWLLESPRSAHFLCQACLSAHQTLHAKVWECTMISNFIRERMRLDFKIEMGQIGDDIFHVDKLVVAHILL